MTKYARYQDYVIKDGRLVGEFEQLYRDFEDPWEQSVHEEFASEKAVCVNLVKRLNLQNVIELGCGFGGLTSRLSQICDNATGLDISETAISKATSLHPNADYMVSAFPDLDLIRDLNPDCIIMSEITWYVLDQLDEFLNFMRVEMPDAWLIHLLMTYPPGIQQYGADKFTDLKGMMDYFGMNYCEWGEVRNETHGGGARTFFCGRFKK